MVHEFFKKYPDPGTLEAACDKELIEILKPLGMSNKRSKTLKRVSSEYSKSTWQHAVQLHGIGKYGSDSDRIFFLGEWREVEPKDGALVYYKNFLTNYFGTDLKNAV